LNISLNSKVGILGLGKTGYSVYKFLQNKVLSIICFDENATQLEKFAGEVPEAKLVDLDNDLWSFCDFIIVSPGVPLYYPVVHKIIQIAQVNNIVIMSDIDVFYQFNPHKYYIGITGTNGKSTCTALLAHIFRKCGKNFLAVGNIGSAICSADIEAEGYIIELSSYQLELTKLLKLHLALCLDITPDHNDRYASFEDYQAAKQNIFKLLRLEGIGVICNHNLLLKLPHAKYIDLSNIKIANEILCDNYSNKAYKLKNNPYLLGEHNNQNIKACYLLSLNFGLNAENIINAISSFKGLRHRLQYLGRKSNVYFYNDSKATNNEATIKALAALKNIYWLAGGLHKTKDFSSILPFVTNIKKAYFFGDAGKDFFDYFKQYIPCMVFDSLDEAFAYSYKEAKGENIESNILFSPASASFDQFQNFEHRGDIFIQMFENL